MDTTSGFDAYDRQHAAMVALEAEVFPANKASLFAALASARITSVTVTFDGSSDNGQVETVAATGINEQTVELPEGKIAFQEVNLEGPAVVTEQRTAREIVEIMTYDLLEQHHRGWEDDDGAYGDFTFDTAERTISLDYNERFTESDNSQHEF